MSDEDKNDFWPIERSQEIAATLMKESDRGCVIFCAAILHDDLESLLREFFRRDARSTKNVIDPLFANYSPLATFSARIDLAYALALIPHDMFEKLHLVRRLRNDFAHESDPLDFEDPRCRDRLRILIAEGKVITPQPGDSEGVHFGSQQLRKEQLINRLAFVLAISAISAVIRLYQSRLKRGFDVRAALMRNPDSHGGGSSNEGA